MPLLNKEKMMDGFGKAVDAVNNAADKAGKYAKEKELDKKIDHAAEVVTKEAKKVGKGGRYPFPGFAPHFFERIKFYVDCRWMERL